MNEEENEKVATGRIEWDENYYPTLSIKLTPNIVTGKQIGRAHV